MNRRQFLKNGLAAAAGVAALGPACLLGDDRNEPTRWAFLADTHIDSDPENRYRGFYPYRNLQEVVGQLTCDLPDGVVIAGDLARLRGGITAYENLRTLLAPVSQHRPIFLGLGNHDRRDDFSHVFEDSDSGVRTVEDRHVVTALAGSMRLIVLDSLIANRMSGLLGHSQRLWLRDFLAMCDERPTILFLHHRPAIDLVDTRLLYEIIGPVSKVKAVVYGHSHRLKFSEHGGIHLINLPATAFNMWRLGSSEPVGWIEAKLTDRGGEFTLHAIGGNRRDDGHTEQLHWRS